MNFYRGDSNFIRTTQTDSQHSRDNQLRPDRTLTDARALANVSLLSRFIGMVTDWRGLLSYSRQQYFRRVL